MYFLLNQLYLHGQILLFMLINMICIPIRQEKIKKLLDVLLNCRWAFSASLLLKPQGLFISFARTKETKQRKFAVCTFLPTPVLFCAKQKELAVAQTAFCF